MVLFQHNHSRSECLPLVKNVLFPTYSFPVFESGNLSRFQFGCGRCFPVLCSLMRFFDCGTQQTICHLAWLTSIWFVIHRICLSISFWYQRTHIRIISEQDYDICPQKTSPKRRKAMKKFLRRAIFQIMIYMGTASSKTTHQKHQPSLLMIRQCLATIGLEFELCILILHNKKQLVVPVRLLIFDCPFQKENISLQGLE